MVNELEKKEEFMHHYPCTIQKLYTYGHLQRQRSILAFASEVRRCLPLQFLHFVFFSGSVFQFLFVCLIDLFSDGDFACTIPNPFGGHWNLHFGFGSK